MWKETILKMWLDGKSFGQIALYTMEQFPELDKEQARLKGRDYIRTTPEYKQRKGQDVTKSNFEYRNDGLIISEKFITIRDGEEITPELILEHHGLKPALWEVVSYKNNMWNTQTKGGEKQISFQSKLTAKPAKQGINFEDIEKAFKGLSNKDYKPVKIKKCDSNMMAEINICDLHLGKLCWAGETPGNFDHKIARDMYYKLLSEIIDEIKGLKLDYITFVWTHDFFNSDNENQTTTGGTQQDTDARVKKLFSVGVQMLKESIRQILEETQTPVKTFYVRSNHDEMTSFYAMKCLEAYFENDPNVEITTNAQPRKYQLYGNTLIGYCHGDKEKASRLASLMPLEASELWSKSKWREMHTGHLHSEHAIHELNGVIVRRISSPTAIDQWHTDCGFIGSVRKAQTFIYDKEWGLVKIINTPVKEV